MGREPKNAGIGRLWGNSGCASACQCGRSGFHHWSGTIPRGAEQLSPWAATTEPAQRSCYYSFLLAVLSLHCSSCHEPGLFPSCHAGPSHPGSFSCCRARVQGSQTPVLEARGLSCSTARVIFLDQRSNPCPSSWAGRFLTTGPPGESLETLSHPSPWTPLLPDPVAKGDEGRWHSGWVHGAVVTNSTIRVSPTLMDSADSLSVSRLFTASEPQRLLREIIRRKACFYR